MAQKVKHYNPKVKKLCIYVGYDGAGQAINDRIKTYAKNRNKTISALVLEALKTAYPDLGL